MRLRLALAYFAVQALAVAGWWALLTVRPAVRPYFELYGAPWAALGAFAPGDLGVVALGSAVIALRRGRRGSCELAWVVVGAMVYAAAYTATTAVTRAAGPLGALLMIPAAGASALGAVVLSRASRAAREEA